MSGEIRVYFARIRSYSDPYVKETETKHKKYSCLRLTPNSGYFGNMRYVYVCLFDAVYVCVCAGQSKTGSIVEAFETLLLLLHELILVEKKDQVILQPFEADASGDVRKSCSQ